MHAVSCLPSVTGAWQYEGGGALWSHRGIYHWDKTLIEGLDVRDLSVREMDMSRIGSVLTGDRRELGDGPPVQVLFIQNQNPLTVCPDSNRVRRGFARDDLFVCVHEQFMTETARWADIVLPATMFMEHDDLYQAGGHTHIQIGPKLIEPPGECRSNHDVLNALAARLGAEHPGFRMSAWEMIDTTLRASGWPDAQTLLDKRWHDAAQPFAQAHFLDGFPHADGRFRFAPDWAAIGADHALMPRLPDHFAIIDEVSAAASVPHGDSAGAAVPQHELHRNARFAAPRRTTDGADPSGRRLAAGRGRGRPRAARERARRGGGACEAVRGRAAGRAGGGEYLAERIL